MKSYSQLTFNDSEPLRVDRFVQYHFPHLSYVMIQKWLRTGAIRINGKRAKGPDRLQKGDEVKVPTLDTKSLHSPEDFRIPKSILDDARSWLVFEDENLLVFNKPQGLAVQGGSKITLSMDRIIQEAWNDREIRIVHRLDKETSGLLLMAKHRQSAQELTKAFHDHEIKKTYYAITIGTPIPPQGRIENFIIKNGQNFEKMQVSDHGDLAITDYKTLKRHKKHPLCLVELTPLTGRTHQLRVHMDYIDTPILGDGKYGGANAHPFPQRTGLALHAGVLELPSGLKFQAPFPVWFQDFFTLN